MTLHALQSPNTFRQLMLEWEKFAPYNAGQFVTLSDCDAVSIDRLSRSWRALVENHELEQLAPMRFDVICPDTSISEHVTNELNHPFHEQEPPFRPFTIHDSSRVHAGIMYRHAFADSVSIRMLMQAWLTASLPKPIEFNYSDSRIGKLRLARELFSEVARLQRIRHVRRSPRKRYASYPVTWSMHELADGLVDRLLRFCRAHGATMNDLFVTLAARVGARSMPADSRPSRTDLGVGTIVDLRDPSQTFFGLSLGFMQTFFTPDEIEDRIRALKASNATSRRIRRRGFAASTRLRLRAALWEHARLNQNDLLTFYRKRCPLIGGISNVNLNRTEMGQWCVDHCAMYTRVSPLGPMLPVVFTPTTTGSKLTLGVTTRDGLINPERRANLVEAFVDELNECVSLQPVGNLV